MFSLLLSISMETNRKLESASVGQSDLPAHSPKGPDADPAAGWHALRQRALELLADTVKGFLHILSEGPRDEDVVQEQPQPPRTKTPNLLAEAHRRGYERQLAEKRQLLETYLTHREYATSLSGWRGTQLVDFIRTCAAQLSEYTGISPRTAMEACLLDVKQVLKFVFGDDMDDMSQTLTHIGYIESWEARNRFHRSPVEFMHLARQSLEAAKAELAQVGSRATGNIVVPGASYADLRESISASDDRLRQIESGGDKTALALAEAIRSLKIVADEQYRKSDYDRHKRALLSIDRARAEGTSEPQIRSLLGALKQECERQVRGLIKGADPGPNYDWSLDEVVHGTFTCAMNMLAFMRERMGSPAVELESVVDAKLRKHQAVSSFTLFPEERENCAEMCRELAQWQAADAATRDLS